MIQFLRSLVFHQVYLKYNYELFPLDQIKFIFCLFLIFPLGFINYFMKGKTARLIYGLVSGILLCYYMYGYEIYHIAIDVLFTHYFISWFGRKRSPFIVLTFTMAHISFVHINRMLFDYGGWNLDVSGIYMMSVVKFSATAFSYDDGCKSDEEIKNGYMIEM